MNLQKIAHRYDKKFIVKFDKKQRNGGEINGYDITVFRIELTSTSPINKENMELIILLHEIGHRKSDQNGHILYRERNAWIWALKEFIKIKKALPDDGIMEFMFDCIFTYAYNKEYTESLKELALGRMFSWE